MRLSRKAEPPVDQPERKTPHILQDENTDRNGRKNDPDHESDGNSNPKPDGVVAQLHDGRVQNGCGEEVLSNDDHPLPIIKFGSQSAICGKTNKMIKARTRAERKGTTPL